MRRFAFVLAIFTSLLNLPRAQAQDPQFTQFYAAPLYLNPGFTGATGEGRLAANYRNQWPGLDANFVTYSFSYDQYFDRIRSGFGLLLKRDEQGGGSTSPLISTDASLLYSYMIPLNDRWAIQAGLQLGYGFRDLNFGSLTFGDQIGDNGPNGNPTGETFANDRIGYFDVSTGAVLYSNNFWFGFSAKHLNQPNLSFTNETDELDMRMSLHAGYKIPFGTASGRNDRDHSITPAIMYLSQGKFDQLSIGTYVNYEPLLLGLWYRGLPIKTDEEFTGINQDAIAVVLGFQVSNLSIGYSYDYTVSRLTNANTQGAHEISLTYSFRQKETGRRKGINYPPVTCPNPWKNYERLRYRHNQN